MLRDIQPCSLGVKLGINTVDGNVIKSNWFVDVLVIEGLHCRQTSQKQRVILIHLPCIAQRVGGGIIYT